MSNFRFFRIMVRAIAVMALALWVSSPALAATTFYGTQTVPGFTADYSITTDDTIGVLAIGNVTGYSVQISNGTNTESFSGTLCSFCLIGAALSSDGTDLFFNYSQAGSNYLWLLNPSWTSYLCFESTGCVASAGDSIKMAGYGDGFTPEQGVQSIASIAPIEVGGVPEPSTWAMMLLGFGAVGFSMRRRGANIRVAQAA